MAPSTSDRRAWQRVNAARHNDAIVPAAAEEETSSSPFLLKGDSALGRSVVITKEEFMSVFAHMALPKRRSSFTQRRRLEDCSPPQAPLPLPPMVEPPPGLAAPTGQNGAVCPNHAPSVGRYEVLLRGLPDTFMYDNVIVAFIQAAGLLDGFTGIHMRPKGKVLITFSTFSMVDECIRFFEDLEWSAAGFPLSALYVQTVKRGLSDSPTLSPKAPANDMPLQDSIPPSEAAAHVFSLDAPEFIPAPGSNSTQELSVDAPAFVPAVLAAAEDTAKKLSADAAEYVPLSAGESTDLQSDDVAVEISDPETRCSSMSPRVTARKLSEETAEYVLRSPGESTNADQLSDIVPENSDPESG